MKNLVRISAVLLTVSSLISCKKKQEDEITPAPVQIDVPSVTISCDNPHLSGFMKGTICAGTTFYLDDNVFVKKGESITIEKGVTIIASKKTAGFYVSGEIISNGTKDMPVVMTVPAANQDLTWTNNIGGWGGIQCDSTTTNIKLLYTNILWTGGPDSKGGAQYSVAVHGKAGSNTNVIVEDCKFFGGQDDGLRLEGPINISIRRNVFQHMGSSDGETINIKAGAVGDVCYNYIWSAANNGIKLESNSKGDFSPYTHVNVYNNTVVSSGFRKMDEPTASVLVDNFAYGSVYNNIFVNNHQGLRITTLAKTVTYGNNLFYSTADSLHAFYYPIDDAGTKQSSDIVSTGINDNSPMFVSFDADVFAIADNNNAHLKTGSPAIGKGNTSAPFTSTIGTATAPNVDLGAFPTDGSGNKF